MHTFMDGDTPHGSSSILTPTLHKEVAPHIEFNQRVRVEATTLDDWATSNDVTRVDVLWLDLQGAEIQVLQRAHKVLESVSMIHIEVNRMPLYDGCATYKEVRTFMKEHGFKEVARRAPIGSGNAIYVKR